MKEEFLSISEFAKRAGVSHQAIYKRLDGDLQPWLQVANGKKTLNMKALELFEQDKSATDSTEVATIKLLQKTVDMLQKELDIKNEQIKDLNDRLAETSQSLRAITHTELAEKIEMKQKEAPAEPIIVEPTPEPAPPDPDPFAGMTDKEIYKIAASKLPRLSIWDRMSDEKIEQWHKEKDKAIAQMSDREREILYRIGFVGDGR